MLGFTFKDLKFKLRRGKVPAVVVVEIQWALENGRKLNVARARYLSV